MRIYEITLKDNGPDRQARPPSEKYFDRDIDKT
jgi:hypothetical protein